MLVLMGGVCSAPVRVVPGTVVSAGKPLQFGGFDVDVRTASGTTGNVSTQKQMKPGTAVELIVFAEGASGGAGDIIKIKEPTDTWKTQKGTLRYGGNACKSDAMATKICQAFMCVLLVLMVAGVVSNTIGAVTAVLVLMVACCVWSAVFVSGILSGVLARNVYDEK